MSNVTESKFEWTNNYRIGGQTKEFGFDDEENYHPHYLSNNESLCDIKIIPKGGNFYEHSFHVNNLFYRSVVGVEEAALNELANETKTSISVSNRDDDADIVITGVFPEDILSARHKIDLLIETSKNKKSKKASKKKKKVTQRSNGEKSKFVKKSLISPLKFTHIVCIPGNTDEIKQNFIKFKEDVLKTCSSEIRIIGDDLFSQPDKLHLTIVMLILLDKEDCWKAAQNLLYCKNNIIKPALEEVGPITIKLSGVATMNDNPKKAKVLYVQAHDESGILQSISDRIADHFIEKGLSKKQFDKVNLHMTVMNTRFLKYKKWLKFDATDILKAHADTYFGTLTVSSVHISERYSSGENGFYKPTSIIKF